MYELFIWKSHLARNACGNCFLNKEKEDETEEMSRDSSQSGCDGKKTDSTTSAVRKLQ